jgi:hypothetical protein
MRLGLWNRRLGPCGTPKQGAYGFVYWFAKGYFAIATIAAAQAALAKMIDAGVLGASRADAHRFFAADGALKRHDYFFFPDFGAVTTARQRCASLSIA